LPCIVTYSCTRDCGIEGGYFDVGRDRCEGNDGLVVVAAALPGPISLQLFYNMIIPVVKDICCDAQIIISSSRC
jgi:hypothetical protein